VIEQTIENCRMLVLTPTEKLAGQGTPAPACIGAIDEGVWELMEDDAQLDLQRRYVRDAGLRKRDLDRVRLCWIRLTNLSGQVEKLKEPVEVAL
jgi:hypothetical protein